MISGSRGAGRLGRCAIGLLLASALCVGGLTACDKTDPAKAGTASVAATQPWATLGPSSGTSLTLIAGDVGGDGALDGQGTEARFSRPADVVVDAAGNVYVADMSNHTVRKITPAGLVSTLAGSSGESGDADGVGLEARFHTPSGLAVDEQGNVFVSDTENHLVRKIDRHGKVSTVAGTSGEAGNTDGEGDEAQFNAPAAVALAPDGSLYVADSDNHVIRKISPGGKVSTVAGLANEEGSTDGVGPQARFSAPQGLTVDRTGHVYVADTGNETLRKITPAGVVTTVAGRAGKSGHRDAAGPAARFNGLMGVRVDAQGTLWVVDGDNHVLRQVTPQGLVGTWAGTVDKPGSTDGMGREARFNSPSGLALDAAGNVYVADTFNEIIRKISPAGEVTTLAGWAPHPGTGNGTGQGARFDQPQSVAVDAGGALYVADRENHTVRKVLPSGVVTTLAGQAGEPGQNDGKGVQAQFSSPQGVAVDASGHVIVADSHNDTLRRIAPDGTVTTLAGEAGESGATDGPGRKARLNTPAGVGMDTQGALYVADFENHTVRKLSKGTVTTLAGAATEAGAADGPGATARFNEPADVVVDASGHIYVADHGNHVIRRITPDGMVSTWAGVAGKASQVDGPGQAARFHHPQGLALDEAGNLYVADLGNHALRKITPDGTVTTLIGTAREGGIRLGSQAPRLDAPSGLVWLGNGRLAVLSNHAVLLATVPVTP
ncbi:MAG: hypothetical protein V4739_03775 [Pseudomonadota bacterium]